MKFEANRIYHIYNRGINKEVTFFQPRNYEYFLGKIKKYLVPHCSIISYCLMPNHFHLMILTPNILEDQAINKGIKSLLSTYSQGINKQENRKGSLFQQNTKAKEITSDRDYLLICFNYIHQNPLRSGLVSKLEDWEYSSYRDYLELRENGFLDIISAKMYIDMNWEVFSEESYKLIPDEYLTEIME